MSLPQTFVKDFHNEESVRRMVYQPLGKTGLLVSKLSIGGGVFSHLYGRDLDEKNAITAIHTALKNGINYIDTAPWYGQGKSEEIYGLALKDVPRSAFYIATKIGRYGKGPKDMFDFSAAKTEQSVLKSLALLQLDYVDVIQIHDIEYASSIEYALSESLPVLQKFVEEGKAKHIGVTGYPLEVLKTAIIARPGQFEVVLAYTRYSLIDNSLKNYLPFFKEQNLGIICASGHGMGLLTNSGPPEWHPAQNEVKELCKNAGELCRKAGIELGKLAMHYFTQLDGPSTFLVGMQTPELVKMNMDVFFNGLNESEEKLLKDLQKNVFTKTYNWE